MKDYNSIPKYYPRAQINGVMYWTCVYCCHLNTAKIQPTAFKVKCSRCEHVLWHGNVFHIPAGPTTTRAKDETIPTWAEEEYPFDPLNFDPMPKAIFDPESRIKQRGRIHMLVIHDNVLYTNDILPASPNTAKEPE